MSYIYLASPYSHPSPEIRAKRFTAVEQYTVWQTKHGASIYSPIVYYHTMSIDYNLPDEYDFWRPLNASMLRGAKELVILRLSGWEDSKGVAYERRLADIADIPWRYADMEEIDESRLWLPCTRAFGGIYSPKDPS
jgi:hypothetical protein